MFTHMSDLVGIQKDSDDTEQAGDYIFFYGKGNDNHEFASGFCT
jgi:hypothetical protein